MATDENKVRLRDQRKPGHLWLDNEIFDVFGDELRQDGISVYTTLARLCYGVSVCMGLREMAAHARMSKDTFARNLKRVIALGLVLERKGATPQSSSTYTLVDVKELKERYLRAAVEESKRQSVSGGDTAPAVTLVDLLSAGAHRGDAAPAVVQYGKCLSVRQLQVLAGPEAVATEVSQNSTVFATEVSQDVRHLRQDTTLKDSKTSTTPQPPASGGSEEFLRSKGVTEASMLEVRLDQATVRVMRGLGMVVRDRESALQRAIREALRLHCERKAWTPEAVGELALIQAKDYRDLDRQGLLRVRYGWVKFFEEGHWSEGGWSLDQGALKAQREARVGM